MRALASVVLLGFLWACAPQTSFPNSPALPQDVAPGADVWNSDNIYCNQDKDCGNFESCISGVCQMKRCGEETFVSRSPLGRRYYFMKKRELVVGDGRSEERRV